MGSIEDRRTELREGDPPRRQRPRQRTLLLGYLVTPGSDRFLRVQVKNLSDTGAKLNLGGLESVAPGVVLCVPRFQSAHEVEVVWKNTPEIGVRFARAYAWQSDPMMTAFLRSAAA